MNENFFKNAEKGKWKKILVKIFRQAKKEVSKMTTYAENAKISQNWNTHEETNEWGYDVLKFRIYIITIFHYNIKA